MPDWLAALEPGAPDVVAAWRGIEAEKFLSVRREVRRRAGAGSAGRILAELDTLADALIDLVEALPEDALAMPGGEEDWDVAETVGHVASSRAFLVLAAGLAASGRWPIDAPPVIPGIPGPAATRPELVRKLARSQRIIARAAARIAGHETDPCLLDHPLVGRLRCGEWLLFAGVHDVMHLEQLHAIETSLAPTVAAGRAAPAGEPAR
jgi:DinB family protein